MIFYLGTHKPQWLARVSVPLFISRRTLAPRKTLPRAIGPWALDSGGFTELRMYRHWKTDAKQYVAEVRRFAGEIGNLQWAAPMDWMCERSPLGKDKVVDMVERTSLSVAAHQRFTVENFLELKALAPELPFIPVLQGWTPGEYFDCWELYERSGVDLRSEPLVGLGTVCRRQSTLRTPPQQLAEPAHVRTQFLLRDLWEEGLRIHGFGFKVLGLPGCRQYLASSDSLAWSVDARNGRKMDGCPHAKCANCERYALDWREKLLETLELYEMDDEP